MADVTVTKKTPKGAEPSRFFDFETPFTRSSLFGMHPFAWMKHFSEEMDRSLGIKGTSEAAAWRPAIEVKEGKGKLSVTAEIPGVKPEDIKIHMTGDVLVVEGERRHEKEEKREGYCHSERSYGRFYRAIPLPEGADADKATANFHNGVLEVMVPIPDAPLASRQIPVTDGAPDKSKTTH